MSDASNPSRSLSEIGHLFLSSVRDRHTGGSPMPVRRPPGASAPAPTAAPAPVATAPNKAAPLNAPMPMAAAPLGLEPAHAAVAPHPTNELAEDLTSEEYELVHGIPPAAEGGPRIPPVSAVIASHLNDDQLDRTIEYARHLAHDGERVGLMEIDGSVFRLLCFDRSTAGLEEPAIEEPAREFFDGRAMADAIEELSWDLDRWLILLPNPRTAEARQILRACPRWVLLCTCAHEAVVSGYRSLKGFADLGKPRISLAVLDADDETAADQVHERLASVCEKFLSWSLEAEPAVRPTEDVAEHAVMLCRPTRSKAELATAPQWQVVNDFLARASEHAIEREAHRVEALVREPQIAGEELRVLKTAQPIYTASQPNLNPTTGSGQGGARADTTPLTSHTPIPAASPSLQPAMFGSGPLPLWPRSANAQAEDTPMAGDFTDVIDLPDTGATAGSILSAVLRNPLAGLVECPVTPPMCPDARLAVTRDHGLIMLAVSRQGLGELRTVARAYRWMIENAPLIRMAIPQMSVDSTRVPRLRLLVDHADLSADVLQPMLESETVTVQSYRRLRWGGKTGLLLGAA